MRCCSWCGDKDDDIRRAAIEILNQTKDERARGLRPIQSRGLRLTTTKWSE